MAFKDISKEQIIKRIEVDNPWWKTGKIDRLYSGMTIHRSYFDIFFNLLQNTKVRRAVVLMGPRRVGKTVMIYQAVQKLIHQGISPQKICYISIDNPTYINIGLEQLFEYAREAVGDDSNEDFYVFFDEIQYLKLWEVHLKSMVDTFLHSKFIVSGSAAAALKLKSNESGAGRFTDFLLPPLSFSEFLIFRGWKDIVQQFTSTDWLEIDIENLNKEFINYLNYGGYPEIITSKDIRDNPAQYISNDIIDKVLLRDLPSLYGIQDVRELQALFTSLAFNTGNEISIDELSKKSGVAKNTIRKYLQYLEAAFLIKIVYRIDFNAKRFKRATQFKVYLTNPSMRSALFAPLNEGDDFMGNMVETAVFAHHRRSLGNVYYARERKEVDYILIDKYFQIELALEIKWSNRVMKNSKKELDGLISFCKKNDVAFVLTSTKDKMLYKNVDGINILFLPNALLILLMNYPTFKMNIDDSALLNTFITSLTFLSENIPNMFKKE